MYLYYSIVDPYPAYRSDISELFGVELRKLGLETEWYMSGTISSGQVCVAYADQKINVPYELLPSKNNSTRLSYWMSDFFHLARQIRSKSGAIQCRDKYLSSLIGLAVSSWRRIPFFYWCSYPFPEQDMFTAEAKTGLGHIVQVLKAKIRFFLLYKVICQRADHVFVQSERMKMDMHAYGIPLERMTPVPMGVTAKIFDWVKTHPISILPTRIVYLGSLASVRNLGMLLDAFLLIKQSSPNSQLMFVGDGDVPAERQALTEKAGALGLGNDVIFTGFVSMEEAWSLSASAAVCVSPIYPTAVLLPASPTKLVEYMALGRPVVCNDHPEQSQIIAESRAGLCVEWSAAAFAKAIVQLLNDPVAAETMAARGPAWVAENRTYPIIAKAVWLKYQSLMPQARA